MVECGGLENRLPLRGYEGSNPSSSAMSVLESSVSGGSFYISRRASLFSDGFKVSEFPAALL